MGTVNKVQHGWEHLIRRRFLYGDVYLTLKKGVSGVASERGYRAEVKFSLREGNKCFEVSR